MKINKKNESKTITLPENIELDMGNRTVILEKGDRIKVIEESEKYIVTDEKGNYALYTNDISEAERVRDEINADLEDRGISGSADILKRVGNTDEYRLYY